jgi:hypothetical protein
MSDHTSSRGLRGRVTAQTEDALGKLAQELLTNPLVSGAISRAFDAREKASQAQEVAFGALNLPSAADIERLTRRLRSVSQRLEGIEDGVDRVDQAVGRVATNHVIEERLTSLEEQLGTLTRMVTELREGLGGASESVPLAQERLAVESAAAVESASEQRPRSRSRTSGASNSRGSGAPRAARRPPRTGSS